MKPGHSFKYYRDAIIEAWEAFDWYNQRSPRAAEQFWNELERSRRLVLQRPEGWNPYLFGTRCIRLRKFPYAIIFATTDTTIVGLAVAHLHRRAGYWRERLTK